jgi:membrane protein insertase Oxa1/YidC/SpoIIIJ
MWDFWWTKGQDFLPILQFSPLNIISPVLITLYSFAMDTTEIKGSYSVAKYETKGILREDGLL